MTIVLLIGAILILTLAPRWWVNKVFAENGIDRPDFPGSGGQLASHLVHRLNVPDALVMIAEQPSHFNPEKKTIILSPEYYNGKSLTAIAVAAHEVGHLIQNEQRNPWLYLRTRLVKLAQTTDRAGLIMIFLVPVASALTRSPMVATLMLAAGVFSMLVNVIVQLVTLPMEYDASFNKALPLLIDGGYVSETDKAELERILKAAAFTYLASALSGLVNLARLRQILRR